MQLSNDGTNPRALRWPSWKLNVNWWLAVIPFVLGFVVFFVPELADKKFESIRFRVGVFLLALPVLILSLLWCWRSAKIALERIICYPILFDRHQKSTQELNDAKKRLFEIAIRKRRKNAFELLNARIEGNALYISIKKKSAQKLNVGDVLFVIHQDDDRLMGVFEVSEVLSETYHAKDKSNIDTLWISYLYAKGESTFMPHMIAFFMNRGVE